MLKQREQEILNNNNEQEKDNLTKLLKKEKNNLKTKIEEEQKELKLRKKTYNDAFNAANFYLYQEEIAKTINELNENKEESLPIINPTLINIFNKNLLTEGKLDKDKVSQVAKELSQNLELSQNKFTNLIKNYLKLK